jgi:hypothetical protein
MTAIWQKKPTREAREQRPMPQSSYDRELSREQRPKTSLETPTSLQKSPAINLAQNMYIKRAEQVLESRRLSA